MQKILNSKPVKYLVSPFLTLATALYVVGCADKPKTIDDIEIKEDKIVNVGIGINGAVTDYDNNGKVDLLLDKEHPSDFFRAVAYLPSEVSLEEVRKMYGGNPFPMSEATSVALTRVKDQTYGARRLLKIDEFKHKDGQCGDQTKKAVEEMMSESEK